MKMAMSGQKLFSRKIRSQNEAKIMESLNLIFRGHTTNTKTRWIFKIIMVFKCQQDSYLKHFKTQIISCQPAILNTVNGNLHGYDVVLRDTILFPEGGGQPHDIGTIICKQAHHSVINVKRVGPNAVHFVLKGDQNELNSGDDVELIVDWDRRWDHMQQHSGQHLISALVQNLFNLNTVSWNLGADVSTIDLEGSTELTDKQIIEKLEDAVNEKIKLSLSVDVLIFERDSPQLETIQSRLKLPEDQTGPIRIINIDGVDMNPCCGTHVSNLKDLQAIKLLNLEKGKKGKRVLHFIVGNRLLKHLDKFVTRERELNELLKCNPIEFKSMVEKLQKSVKISHKNSLNLNRELAILEAEKFINLKPKPRYHFINRKDGHYDFANIFINEIKSEITGCLIFICIADDSSLNSSGQITMIGEPNTMQVLTKLLTATLDAKGFLKDGKFQAKVKSLSKLSVLEKDLRNHELLQ